MPIWIKRFALGLLAIGFCGGLALLGWIYFTLQSAFH